MGENEDGWVCEWCGEEVEEVMDRIPWMARKGRCEEHGRVNVERPDIHA